MSIIEVANFAAGIQDVPAFQGEKGGASRMENYLVDPDGELIARPGYQVLSTSITHISADGQIDAGQRQTGPLAVIDGSSGTRFFFRLPAGATYVLSKDKVFIAVPQQRGSNIDPSGYWVDVSGTSVSDDDIYRWTSNSEKGGDHVRPSAGDSHFKADSVHAGLAAVGVSHPVIVGLTGTAPNSEAPIEIAIRTASAVRKFKISIKVDETGSDDVFWKWDGNNGAGVNLLANSTYVWQWAGTDAGYDDFEESVASALSTFWRWLTGGKVYKSDKKQTQEISQEDFEKCYLEVEYTLNSENYKYRYYLYSHRSSDIGPQIAASLQAGLTVGQIGVSTAGPYGAIPGAAVAVAGVSGALLNKASEGTRVRLAALDASPVTPAAEDGGGFQPGQYVFCHTYSDEERIIESLPSRTTEMMMFDFPGLGTSVVGRTKQKVSFTVYPDISTKTPNWDWATHVNVYAARTTNPDSHNKLAQGTGLDFQLVARTPLSGITALGRAVEWVDERYYSADNDREDAAELLISLDNDPPTRTLDKVVSYASRVWGVDVEDNSIRYSKLAPDGYHFFPSENALIPQVLTLDNSNSPIVKIHAASNDSMLYVFRQDEINVLRGHGEIRGLYVPDTPITVDLDASMKIEDVGTMSPHSVVGARNLTLFVGSDKILYSLSGTRLEPFALSIQPYLDRLTDTELATIFAFPYRNAYLLCLPNEILSLDLQKRYWTTLDWTLKDAFWAQMSSTSESKLYALDTQDNLLSLYDTELDNGQSFSCLWESNPLKIPPNGLVTGIYVIHDESVKSPLSVSLKVDNGAYQTRRYTPTRSNRFRQGFHVRGQRVQVKVEDSNMEKLRIDRIALEIQP